MTPEIQQAIITYVVPAMVFAYLELRRRRLSVAVKHEQIETSRRASDYEIGQQMRDEIRASNMELRKRVVVLERRVDVLTDLVIRHGIQLPLWDEAGSGDG